MMANIFRYGRTLTLQRHFLVTLGLRTTGLVRFIRFFLVLTPIRSQALIIYIIYLGPNVFTTFRAEAFKQIWA